MLIGVPSLSYLEVHSFDLERFVANSSILSDGVMTSSGFPGHGVIFDWDALAEFSINA